MLVTLLMAFLLLMGLVYWFMNLSGYVLTFLLWNTFLAILPFVFYRCFERVPAGKRGLRGLLAFAWLIFYPNALYMITDVIHLQQITFYTFEEDMRAVYTLNISHWIYVCLLALSIFLSLVVGFLSYFGILGHIQGRWKRWVFHGLVSVLVGEGLVLGRFSRLNSWDILIHPGASFDALIQLATPKHLLFGLLFCLTHILFVLFLWQVQKYILRQGGAGD